MLTQARGLEASETGSALEAALAEVDEIHRFSPPYNRALRPDGRRLWFAAPDFSRIAPDYNEGCPIGPLPDERTAAALLALARIWENTAAVELAAASLGVSADRVPDRNTFRAGIEFFRFRHGPGRAPAHRRLKVLARRLWEEKKTAAAETIDANEETDNDPQDPVEEKADWTPETVSGRLESMLCHGGRMLRRARWLVLLSEATLVWRGASEGDARRLMVFEKGRPCKVGHLAASRQIPVPPGHRRSMDRRRDHIDLAAYDRLRVLTTELRRLLCEGRDPVLRLSDPTTLGPAQIARTLFWF
jgi:DNA polymerase-3 subunit epsilon